MATKKQLTLFYLLLLLTSFAEAQDEQINLFPITDVVPEYPAEAIIREAEGWVLVTFDVTPLGVATNIVVSDSEPRLTFDESAISAASKFRFDPHIENGIAEEVTGVEYLFNFALSQTPGSVSLDTKVSLNKAAHDLDIGPRINRRGPSISQIANEDMLPIVTVAPTYPEEALNQNIGGWVLLRFEVTDQGNVLNPVVEESVPPNIFDDSAINAISQFKYSPYTPEESLFNRLNVFHLFKFRPTR